MFDYTEHEPPEDPIGELKARVSRLEQHVTTGGLVLTALIIFLVILAAIHHVM